MAQCRLNKSKQNNNHARRKTNQAPTHNGQSVSTSQKDVRTTCSGADASPAIRFGSILPLVSTAMTFHFSCYPGLGCIKVGCKTMQNLPPSLLQEFHNGSCNPASKKTSLDIVEQGRSKLHTNYFLNKQSD